jgi:hypothetical protein
MIKGCNIIVNWAIGATIEKKWFYSCKIMEDYH